ncbi:MAG: TylF/MycF/NovP-related O-methyltransferase [Spirochaetota bacterium]
MKGGRSRTDFQAMIEELQRSGYGVVPPQQFRSDLESEFIDLWERIRAYTMVSMERAYALYSAVHYVVKAGIPGDFVECGVWKGGAAMLMALTLLDLDAAERRLYLFDTFQGMTPPTENDKVAYTGQPVIEKWDEDLRGEKNNFGWWAIPRQEVAANIHTTGYPESQVCTVEGDVLQTIPQESPGKIALLRLDTDWYESTLHELQYLYPCLETGGVLLLDDYGHFTGARKAVDEYFADTPVFLHRDDYTGRSLVKP